MASMLKAIIAGLIAAGGSIVTGLGDNTLSAQEIVTAVVVGLVALGSVYGVANVPKAPGA